MNIQNRLKALEQGSGLGSDLITVIVRRIVNANGDMEPARVIRNYGKPSTWSVEREQGESLEAFRERAYAAAPRREGEIPRLIERT